MLFSSGLIILEDELEQWVGFGAQQPLPTGLLTTTPASSPIAFNTECLIDTLSLSRSPVLKQNCSDAEILNGSPLVFQREHPSNNFMDNEISKFPPHQTVVVGMKTGRRGLRLDLCIFHTICGWLNTMGNESPKGAYQSKDNFRESLGRHCRRMDKFLPSLVRHALPDRSVHFAAFGT